LADLEAIKSASSSGLVGTRSGGIAPRRLGRLDCLRRVHTSHLKESIVLESPKQLNEGMDVLFGNYDYGGMSKQTKSCICSLCVDCVAWKSSKTTFMGRWSRHWKPFTSLAFDNRGILWTAGCDGILRGHAYEQTDMILTISRSCYDRSIQTTKYVVAVCRFKSVSSLWMS
jgi:hypothetical protein